MNTVSGSKLIAIYIGKWHVYLIFLGLYLAFHPKGMGVYIILFYSILYTHIHIQFWNLIVLACPSPMTWKSHFLAMQLLWDSVNSLSYYKTSYLYSCWFSCLCSGIVLYQIWLLQMFSHSGLFFTLLTVSFTQETWTLAKTSINSFFHRFSLVYLKSHLQTQGHLDFSPELCSQRFLITFLLGQTLIDPNLASNLYVAKMTFTASSPASTSWDFRPVAPCWVYEMQEIEARASCIGACTLPMEPHS